MSRVFLEPVGVKTPTSRTAEPIRLEFGNRQPLPVEPSERDTPQPLAVSEFVAVCLGLPFPGDVNAYRAF
jgi:hypothetical protein